MKGVFVSAVLVAAALVSGCTKQSLENTYNNQESKIDTYINSLLAKDENLRVVHNSGAHRVVLVEGEGDELTSRGSVAFYYAGYVFTNGLSASNLFFTNDQATAESANWKVTGADFSVKVEDMADAELLKGLRNGLVGVKGGEECVIVFSGKYGFGKKAVGTIPANSALAYHVWVESVNND